MNIDVLNSIDGFNPIIKDKTVKVDNNFKDILSMVENNKEIEDIKNNPSEIRDKESINKDLAIIKDNKNKDVVNNLKIDNLNDIDLKDKLGTLDLENGDEIQEEVLSLIALLFQGVSNIEPKINELNSLNEISGIENKELKINNLDNLLENINSVKEIILDIDMQPLDLEKLSRDDKLILNDIKNYNLLKDNGVVIGINEGEKITIEDINDITDNIASLIEELDKVILITDDNPRIKGEKSDLLAEELTKIKGSLEKTNNILKESLVIKDNLSEREDFNSEDFSKEKVIDSLIEDQITVVDMEEIPFSNNNEEEGKNHSKQGQDDREKLVLEKIILGEESNKLTINNNFSRLVVSNENKVIPSIDIEKFSIDTVKNIKYMINNSVKELVAKVNPGNLGEVTIKLSMVGNELKANISTESKEILNYIRSNEIKNILGNENIKVTDVNISLYQDDTTFFKNESGFSGSYREQGNKHYRENNKFISLEDEVIEDKMDIKSLDIII